MFESCEELGLALEQCYNEAPRNPSGKPVDGWWEPALQFAWDVAKTKVGKGTVTWVEILHCWPLGAARNKKFVSLTVSFNDERHWGQVVKVTEGDDGKAQTTLRMQVMKYNIPVKTGDDEISVLKDAHDQPIYPDDEHLSSMFRHIWYVAEAFRSDVEMRKDRADELIAAAKQWSDQGCDFKDAYEEWKTKKGLHRPSDIILSADKVTKLVKWFSPEVHTIVPPVAICVKTDQVCIPIQERMSNNPHVPKEKKNVLLPNPILRVKIGYDETGVPAVDIYDKRREFVVDKRVKYEPARMDEQPLTIHNIERFFKPSSRVDGTYALSVCCSNLGISLIPRFVGLRGRRGAMVVMPPCEAVDELDVIYAKSRGADKAEELRKDADDGILPPDELCDALAQVGLDDDR